MMVAGQCNIIAWNALTNWNALTRNGGSIYCIYYLQFLLVHSWAEWHILPLSHILPPFLVSAFLSSDSSAIWHLCTFSSLWSEVWKWYIYIYTEQSSIWMVRGKIFAVLKLCTPIGGYIQTILKVYCPPLSAETNIVCCCAVHIHVSPYSTTTSILVLVCTIGVQVWCCHNGVRVSLILLKGTTELLLLHREGFPLHQGGSMQRTFEITPLLSDNRVGTILDDNYCKTYCRTNVDWLWMAR